MRISLERDQVVPLTPHELYVLLALAGGQDNGYALRSRVEQDSGGAVTLAAGTLYPLLKRLAASGYIIEIAAPRASGPTGVSKVYRLSDTGATVLGWELDRYAAALKLGQDRLRSA